MPTAKAAEIRAACDSPMSLRECAAKFGRAPALSPARSRRPVARYARMAPYRASVIHGDQPCRRACSRHCGGQGPIARSASM